MRTIWWRYLIAGVVPSAGDFSMPMGLGRDLVYCLIGASGSVAIVVGVRRHGPPHRLGWYLMASGNAGVAVPVGRGCGLPCGVPDAGRRVAGLAYVNSPQDAAPVRTALDENTQTAFEIPSPTLSLIELHRDNGVYEWRTIAELHV